MRQGKMVMSALATLLVVAGARSGAIGAGVNLDRAVRFGKHWYGPNFSKEDLKGRVVLIEDWGIS